MVKHHPDHLRQGPHSTEHVAVSYDRRRIVANYFANPGREASRPGLWLFALEAGTEQALVPQFTWQEVAVSTGILDGNIYFAGVESCIRPAGAREQLLPTPPLMTYTA